MADKEETNPLAAAKFSSSLFFPKEIPKEGIKFRVLTRDPMVYVDNFGNTKYVFAVYNITEDAVQLLDKGPGFSQRFQEIDSDTDYGNDVRKIDLKVTTNGKSGKEIRYTIMPVGSPGELPKEATITIYKNGFDLAEKVQKQHPNALRLSEVNQGKKPMSDDGLSPENSEEDLVIEDIPDDINLDDIPF